MSTKTSIKRIALVAATALTLGGFSVITATSAHAAASNNAIAGLNFSSSTNFSAVDTTTATPGTTSNPLAITVVANSTFAMDIIETASVGVAVPVINFGSLSTFADTGSVSTFTVTKGVATRAGASDTVTSIVAPSTTGTYYAEVSPETVTAGITRGYVAIKVVNVLATTYDGNIYQTAGATNGTTTASGVAGTNNTLTLTVAKHAAGGKAGFITVSGAGATINTIDGAAAAAGVVTGKVTASGSEAVSSLIINTPTAGSITVTYAPESSAGSGLAGAVTDTINITVNASGSAGVFSQ